MNPINHLLEFLNYRCANTRCSETKIQKLLDVNSCYAAAYPRGAILAPRPRRGEGIPCLGVGLRCGVGA